MIKKTRLLRKSLIRIFSLILVLFTVYFVQAQEKGVTDMNKDVSLLNASIPSINTESHTNIETATFALGWFWGPDSRFGSIPGVVRTRVGYAGGKKSSPTYRSLGDHTETVQIDFDPEIISYRELLDVFWKSHEPTHRPMSKQYMPAVFFHNEEQKRIASETRDLEAKKRNRNILTEILQFTGFYLAEDYHQKFRLQHYDSIMQEINGKYPDMKDFINSTAAARLNGYLGGYGTPENLQMEINRLGLSEQGRKNLLAILSESRPAFRSCSIN